MTPDGLTESEGIAYLDGFAAGYVEAMKQLREVTAKMVEVTQASMVEQIAAIRAEWAGEQEMRRDGTEHGR